MAPVMALCSLVQGRVTVSVNDSIRRFIAGQSGFTGSESDLTDDRELIAEEILDSVGIYQLVGYLEEHFDIEVDDDELVYENFATITDIAKLVEQKQG
jgi:acyl carrier protein